MKLVGSVTEAMRSIDLVRDRPDRHDGNERRQHQNQKDPEKKQEQPTFEVNEKKVSEAIQAFQSDTQNKANGLHASMSGKGPGLKVVLTDGRGAVVRQFTGEEFIQLREAVSKDGRVRGKILDQKL